METVQLAQLPIKAGDVLLDLGCGEGRHSLACRWHFPEAHRIGLDLNPQDLRSAQERELKFFSEHEASDASAHSSLYLQGNALTLPFADESIDHVLCSEVLEHLPQYCGALDEIHRVLKPGGSLAVSVPRAWPEAVCWALSRAYHEVEGGHVRIFNARALRAAIISRQFVFRRRHWAHALHVPYWWLRCLYWNRGSDWLLSRWYHKLLVWDIVKQPRLTRQLEKWLNPVMGKSLVMYFTKADFR